MTTTSAYLEVTFTKSVELQSGTLIDLKDQFSITDDGGAMTIDSATINNGKVRLKLIPNQVPQPGSAVVIQYTNPGTGVAGALVDSTTGYPVADLTVISNQTWPAASNPIPESITPTIISAIVYHEKPKEIVVSFTVGRDISNNSTKNSATEGTAGYGITPNHTLGNTGASSTPEWDVGMVDPSFSLINSVTLTTHHGEIQNGMTVSLGIAGEHLADQFDLSVNNITFSVTNNVKQIILDNAYISNVDPSAVICLFQTRRYECI